MFHPLLDFAFGWGEEVPGGGGGGAAAGPHRREERRPIFDDDEVILYTVAQFLVSLENI